jgi:hypothetical protein
VGVITWSEWLIKYNGFPSVNIRNSIRQNSKFVAEQMLLQVAVA